MRFLLLLWLLLLLLELLPKLLNDPLKFVVHFTLPYPLELFSLGFLAGIRQVLLQDYYLRSQLLYVQF